MRWQHHDISRERLIVTSRFPPASPELQGLHQDAEALGYQPNMDFVVRGIPGFNSSELIILVEEEGHYIVYYQDMGRSREVARSSEFSVIRTRFLEELANLAGPRGRGPTAGQKREDPYEGMSVDERVSAMRKLGKFPRRRDVERDAPPNQPAP